MWEVFAAYDSDLPTAHPLVARYPAPQRRVCGDPNHLAEALLQDAAAPGSTMQWLVRLL